MERSRGQPWFHRVGLAFGTAWMRTSRALVETRGGRWLRWLERSHRGRQAGFREHTLVCVATCQLMLIGVYDWHGGAIVVQAYDVSASRVIHSITWSAGGVGALDACPPWGG